MSVLLVGSVSASAVLASPPSAGAPPTAPLVPPFTAEGLVASSASASATASPSSVESCLSSPREPEVLGSVGAGGFGGRLAGGKGGAGLDGWGGHGNHEGKHYLCRLFCDAQSACFCSLFALYEVVRSELSHARACFSTSTGLQACAAHD